MCIVDAAYVGLLPSPDLKPSLIEDSLVVVCAHFLNGVLAQQIPQGAVLIEDLQVLLLSRGRDLVGAEKETVRVSGSRMHSITRLLPLEKPKN